MANVYKNAEAIAVGTSFTNVYTVPGGMDSIIIEMLACNLQNSGIDINVRRVRADLVTINLLQNVPLPPGSTINVVDSAKIVLTAGESIEVSCSVAAGMDVHASLVEDVNS